jgi:hypothetical protein
LLHLLLSSCGGGGGGGAGDGDASYAISMGNVTFSATEGGVAPAPQIVTVTVNSGAVFIATSQAAIGITHVFQITGPTTGQITITPDSPTTAGTFGGTITVTGCSTFDCSGGQVSGSPKVINVTYVVSPLSALSTSPTELDFLTSVGVMPTPKSIALDLSTGAGTFTTNVTYQSGTSGWIEVNPSSGPVPGTVDVGVFPVPPAGTHTAAITFTAGGVVREVPVTLTVQNPAVNFISPYVATAGVGGEVVIRGFGFSAVASGVQVMFGTTSATNAAVVDDTEIHATYPLLPAGTYPVVVQNASLTLPSRNQVRLVVVSPPQFAPTSFVRNTQATDLIYDAERQSIYLAGDGVERYRFDGLSWVKKTLGFGFTVNEISLAPDGAELLSANVRQLVRINAETFDSVSFEDATSLVGTGTSFLGDLAFANDGTAIGAISRSTLNNPSLYRFDMLTRRFDVVSRQIEMGKRLVSASGNGRWIVMPNASGPGPRPVFTYSTVDRSLTPNSENTEFATHVTQSGTGERIIISSSPSTSSRVTTVYGTSFAVLGNLPSNLKGVVISADGATAFAYFNDTNTVRKFDLNAPIVGGFREIGAGTAVLSTPGSDFVQMALGPDGSTLFMAGNQALVIMTTP